MKRFISSAFALILSAVLSGCAAFDAVTAYSLYSGAAKKLKKAGGYEADCALSMSFDVLDGLESGINMNIKVNGDSAQLSADISDNKIVTTYIGDTVYVESGETMIKYKGGSEDSKTLIEKLSDGSIPKLSKVELEDLEVVKNDDGTRQITVRLNAETGKGALGSMFDSFGDLSVDLGEINFDEVTCTMLFDKKKNLSKMTMECTFETSILSTFKIGGKLTMDYSFLNFGTAPEIALLHPESDYKEAESADGSGLLS